VGAIPEVSSVVPLIAANGIVTVASGSQYYCSVQAFDPVSLVPLWEEHVGADCTSNYGNPRVLDVGGGRIAFLVENVAYLARRPGPAPLHSITALSPSLDAALEVGATWTPDNQFAILSPQTTVPVTSFLLPDQVNDLTLGAAYERSRFWPLTTPAAYTIGTTDTPAPLAQYSGKAVALLSNTTNPQLSLPYRIAIVKPYPLQASASSLSFTWRPGTTLPAAQTVTITKQGEQIAVGFTNGLPNWLSAQSSGNGLPVTLTLKVNPTGLAAGTYTTSVQFGNYGSESLTLPVTLTVLPASAQPPSITSVQDAESSVASIVPGEWVAIYGSGLAATSRAWNAGDFTSGNLLPTALDGVGVTFAGIPAAVYYVNPSQINVQAPSTLSGSVPVVVSLNNNPSAALNVTVVAQSPSLFVYRAGSQLYAAATHLNGGLIGDPAVQAGSTPASAGESVVLYVNGLASSPSGSLVANPQQYTGPVAVKVGSANAAVSYAGLVAAGQFQLNVQVPTGLPPGDYTLAITAGVAASPGSVILPIR
jgi:uncharacterized protein (TIGR03437 family)